MIQAIGKNFALKLTDFKCFFHLLAGYLVNKRVLPAFFRLHLVGFVTSFVINNRIDEIRRFMRNSVFQVKAKSWLAGFTAKSFIGIL